MIIQTYDNVFKIERYFPKKWFQKWITRQVVDDWGPLCDDTFSSYEAAQVVIEEEIEKRLKEIDKEKFVPKILEP